MHMVNNRLPVETSSGAGAPEASAQRSGRSFGSVLTLARRTARLTTSTGLAGSLALGALMGSALFPGADVRAQVANVCTGLSLDESILRDRLVPILQAVVNPIETTVDPLVSNLGTVVGALSANLPVVGPILSPGGVLPVTALNLDVGGILGGVAAGDPLGIQLLGPDGTVIGPGDDCIVAADAFQLDGTQGISIGGNAISGLGSGAAAPAVARTVDSIAFGDNAQTGTGSGGAIALGVDSNVGASAAGGIAVGDTAIVGATAVGSVAIGAGATVGQANSVALGAGSTTTRGAQPAYAAVGLGAGQSSTGEVAIGGRTLTGLAAGTLAGDAVNVQQLTSVANAVGSTASVIGGGAAFNPATGVFTPPSFTVQGAPRATVGAALTALDGQVTANTTNITNLTNGTAGLVQQALPGGPITVGAAVGGTTVGCAGSGGPRVLTGVAGGDLAAGSVQAVNGSQLFATNTTVGALGTGLVGTADALGGGAGYDPATGLFTPPAFVLNSVTGAGTESFANVGDALDNLDDRTLENTTDITELTTNIETGAVGLVRQATPTGPVSVAALTGGLEVDFSGTQGTRTLTGIADGEVAAGSTDAVTGAQLFATNTAVLGLNTGVTGTAGSLGGGAGYDPATGIFTPPAYVLASVTGIGTQTFTNVGDALGNLDTRTFENTTDITNLTTNIDNGTVGLVRQLADGTIAVAGLTGGVEVDFTGTDGERVLTGIADGDVVDGSTDAVTGSQLFATNTAVGTVQTGLTNTAALIGAGASYNPATGTFTPPTFSLDGGTFVTNTVGGAIENLDTRTTTLAEQIGSGAIGLVLQDATTGAITVGAASGGTLVNFVGTAGPRVLTGVQAGAVAAGSTDAVNGGQLFATNTALSASLGAGASFDPVTGVFTPPTFTLGEGDETFDDVGGAIENLDGRVIQNTTDIANLEVQIGSGQIGLVQQAAPGANLTVGASTDGAAVDFAGTAGARTLTGLADGTVADGSTDAVTGNQAFATSTSIASALGGGAAVALDGTLSAPTYTIGGTGFTDAGSAFAALDTSVTALQNQVGAFDPDGSLVYVSVNSTAGPARATGTETVAIGGGSVASGANASAYGSGASATGAGSSAFGAGASAGFENSSAIGAGASATRANQMVFGTSSNTYTMPGVTSAASRAAQSGPIDLVTTDAAGNLASLPLSDFFSGVSAIEAELGRMDRKFERQADGIAIAMALGAVALPADKTFALTGSVSYFDDTAAFGIGAVGQIADNWYLNGGVGVGTERGTVAGRAGLTYAW